MKRKDAKNDFFYGVVMVAMFAATVFNVAVEYFDRQAAFVVAEAVRPRAAMA